MNNSIFTKVYLFLCRKRKQFIFKSFHRIWGVFLGSDIYCPIPNGLLLPHPYGIVIHSGCILGENVVIMQQVTLGQKSLQYTTDEVPVICSGSYIGAGAKIIGPVRVGHNAIIGANAVVTKDVPDNATVVGYNKIIKSS